MKKDVFYQFGRLTYECRWFIIIFWALVLLATLPCIPKLMEPFKSIGFIDPASESAKTDKILNDRLGYSYNRFLVIYSSKKLLATEPAFQQEIKKSLSGLKDLSIKNQIIYPSVDNKQISKDKHTAFAVVLLKGNQEADHQLLDEFRGAIKAPKNLSMKVGGAPIFLDDTKRQTQIDLFKAEYIATPVAIITMLIVFGSVVAASIPIILGGICALLILTTLYILGHCISLSVFTINIALLLGLCLSLDYALLIVSRYRDELNQGISIKDAIAITQATAGKAVFFSGLAVFISLSALLLFPINVLFSVGVGGLVAVSVAVAIAIILLPAVLAVLNHKLNYLSIRFFRSKKTQRSTYWRWLVKRVVKRPLIYFISILCVLLFLGYPFLHVHFGISDFRILPKTQESRQVFDTFETTFGESKLAPIVLLLKSPDKSILTNKNIGSLYRFADRVMDDSRVEQVSSIVSTVPRLTKAQYQMLYTQGRDNLNPELKKLLQITTNKNLTVMTVISKYDSNSTETTALVKKLRHMEPGGGLKLDITGSSVNTIDVLKSISSIFPYAFLWIIGFTYLIMLIFLRSVILPLKAIITTMLSLGASYGVLVFVIQYGYLHHLLNFVPQEMLDISLLIIIFCALFGISMDYEVFLLTRIKECYEQTGDNIKSIEYGIERSSRIITSAAIIVILICFSFMSADILIVKAFGLGIAVAVFVDAFLIRTILVPATMALLGKWNWYLPKWLDRILPKISFDPHKYER